MCCAVSALADPNAERLVDAEVVGALLLAINRLDHAGNDTQAQLLSQVVAHVEGRWYDLAPSLSTIAVHEYIYRARILAAFPALVREPTFVSLVISARGNPKVS